MLPLRICLVLAILAGIGVIVVSQAVLKPQFEGIIQVRNDNKIGWDKTEVERKQVAKSLKETEVELSKLIDILNERYGTDFTQAYELFFLQLREEAMQPAARTLLGRRRRRLLLLLR